MPDMLVKLYTLPALDATLDALRLAGVRVRPARVPEKPLLLDWVNRHFAAWAPEVEAALARLPVTCLLALRDGDMLGFACYDAFAPNFFGPMGVAPDARGQGVGRALLLSALHAQKAQGYAYAIIGGVGPAAFYAKTVDAVVIEGSTPGAYADLLHASAGAD